MRFFLFTLLPLLAFFLNASCRENAVNNPQNVSSNKNSSETNSRTSSGNGQIPVYTYEIVNTFKHDPKAFTEGLTFHKGFLYESTGSPDYNGNSSLRKIELESGDVKQKRQLDKKYFGEGMTVLGDKIYQLTWNEKTAFVYNVNTFEQQSLFAFTGEGWGMTNDGTNLIIGDGSHILKFVDPTNFRVVRTINVFNNGKPLTNINELEFIKGEIWANIWHSEEPDKLGKPNYIVRLDPKDGKILGWVDLAGISPDDSERDPENTLNGIAYDAENDRIFVTGKQWRKLFEIKVKPKN